MSCSKSFGARQQVTHDVDCAAAVRLLGAKYVAIVFFESGERHEISILWSKKPRKSYKRPDATAPASEKQSYVLHVVAKVKKNKSSKKEKQQKNFR